LLRSASFSKIIRFFSDEMNLASLIDCVSFFPLVWISFAVLDPFVLAISLNSFDFSFAIAVCVFSF
jgi:hypothetical protein